MAPLVLLRLPPPCSFHPMPSRKLWPLPQSTKGSPMSFSSDCFLFPPRSLDKCDLESPAPRHVFTSPCFSLCCLASVLASPWKQPPSRGELLHTIYGYCSSLSPLCLQTSFSPRLSQRRLELGSSDEECDPTRSRVSKTPSIPPISPTCHLRRLQPAWVKMLPLPHLAGSIWLQPELLFFFKPPDG